MTIKIAEKLRPFTHRPGMKIPVPGSQLILQAFPTLLRVFQEGEVIQEIPLRVSGPVKEFTAQLDLEKGKIHVWGRGFRVAVFAGKNGIQMRVKKGAFDNIGSEEPVLEARDFERLSLGSHKSQDWDGVTKRNNPVEYFPIWFRLGQLIPPVPCEAAGGTLSLLKSDFDSLCALWHAGFEGMLSPRLEDSDFQGFDLPPASSQSTPTPLLSEGWKKIRELFFRETDEQMFILPKLPKEFHCGRLVGVKTIDGVTLNIEWSKKQLRRMEIYSPNDRNVMMNFPKPLKSYRFGNEKRVGTGNFLQLEKEKWVILDNFRK